MNEQQMEEPVAEVVADAKPDRPKAWSYSSLEMFRESAEKFEATYITRTIPRRPSGKEAILGTVFEWYLLDRPRFEKQVAILPVAYEINPETKRDGDMVAEAKAKDPNIREVISEYTLEHIKRMDAAVMKSREAMKLLESYVPQKEYRWQDPKTGLWLCAYVDIDRVEVAGEIVDLKCMGRPSPKWFAQSCTNSGYHRQAALYQVGIETVTGECPRFKHLVVGSDPNYTPVAVYSLGAAELELGHRQIRRTLDDLAIAIELNDFRSAWATSIQPLTFPRYAFYDE